MDKCIYFKGEEECPPAVLKMGKEQAWKEELWWVSDHFPYKSEEKNSSEDFYKKIIKDYKDSGLSHFRKHDGVCISLKAFLYMRYSYVEPEHTVDGFKHWYDNVYYAKNTPSSISRDYLLHLTLAYKGEEECPAEYDGQFMGKIWLAESVAVENLLNTSNQLSKEWGFEFYKMVAMLIEKWSPYDYMSILSLYFQDFGEFIKKVYKEVFGIIM